MQGEIVDQLREVVKAREAAIAHLSNEQVQASLMFEAVRLERDRLQHEVFTYCTSPSRLYIPDTLLHGSTSSKQHKLAKETLSSTPALAPRQQSRRLL